MNIKSLVGMRLGLTGLNRSTSTNPFDNIGLRGRTFRGNALPFADVFQSIKPVQPPKPNHLKIVSASVIGAMVALKTRLYQPISLFANQVRQNIARGMAIVHEAGKSFYSIGNTITGLNKDLSGRISKIFRRKETLPIENDNVAKILKLKNINKNASVSDLRATWIHENAKIQNSNGKAVA